MKLCFGILDDEKNLLNIYEEYINGILAKNNIPGKVICATANPKEFIEVVRTCEINVCIIDINLNTNTNGMHLAKEIRKMKIPTEIIFVTGHLQYMKNAFHVRAFDYLEKPVDIEELEKCINRLYKEMEASSVIRDNVIKIKSGTTVYYIPAEDIIYIEHIEFKSVIFTSNRKIETYESLSSISNELPKDIFKQCHRAVWVNTQYIDCINFNKTIIKLKNGMECNLGKTFKKEFMDYAV